MSDETAGIGHNQSPYETMKTRVASLIENANRWLKERPEITDEDMAAKCNDFVTQLTQQGKAIEKERGEANKPHREAQTANNKKYGTLTELIDASKVLMKAKLGPWLIQKEKERQEAEREAEETALEAMKLAEETAAALEAEGAQTVEQVIEAKEAKDTADAAVKEASRVSKSTVAISSDVGGSARGLATKWFSKITDEDKAFKHFRDHPKMKDLIVELAGASARNPASREANDEAVTGVKIWSEQGVR
jgi:hypothetical protein